MLHLRLPLLRRRSLSALLLAAAIGAPAAVAAPVSPSALPLRLEARELGRFVCTADVAARTMACQPLVTATPDLALRLAAPAKAPLSGTWAPSLSVQSLATGGATLTAVSVQALGQPITTAGRGTVAVGADAGTIAAYGGTLFPGSTSQPQPWAFTVDADVEAFTVQVAVVGSAVLVPMTLSSVPAPYGKAGDVDATPRVLRTSRGIRLPIQDAGTWTSSEPSVATVDANGTVTRVAAGSTVITYSVGGRAVQQTTVQVCPTLAVGEVYHFSDVQGASICIDGVSGTSEYTLIASNQNANVTSLGNRTISVTASGIQGVTGPPSPVAGRSADLTAQDLPGGEVAADLRPVSDVPTGARMAGPSAYPVRPVPAVGDSLDFNTSFSCTASPVMRRGGVRVVTDHAIVVVDGQNPAYAPNTTSPASAFTPENVGLWFETINWAAVTPHSGRPTDLDGNGRVVLFITRAVNELSPPASSATTHALMMRHDLLDPAQCAGSNGGEIVYLLTPDPTGVVNSNVRTESFVAGNASRTVGVELMRLALHGRRMASYGTVSEEEPWLESALMGVAEELMFYNQSWGLPPRANINLSNLTTGPSASRRVAAFNTYANQGYTRFRPFLQRPDSSGAMRSFNSLAARGAGWAFLRYALDRVGGPDSLAVQAMAGGQMETGRENLRRALGLGSVEELEQWYRDFLVATYTDDAISAGVTARYTHPSWNFRSVYGGLGGFPLGVRALGNGVPLTLSVRGGGGAVYYRMGVADGGTAVVTTTVGGATSDPSVRFSIVRTK